MFAASELKAILENIQLLHSYREGIDSDLLVAGERHLVNPLGAFSPGYGESWSAPLLEEPAIFPPFLAIRNAIPLVCIGMATYIPHNEGTIIGELTQYQAYVNPPQSIIDRNRVIVLNNRAVLPPL